MTSVSASWDPQLTNVASVGGKANSLFRLLELGAPVPPFFVLTTAAHEMSEGGKIGPKLRSQIGEALATLGDVPVAVRSSATAEDSADHSFAGVFESILDVRGLDFVCQAIEHCWRSFESGRAASYRGDRGLETEGGMAVVVQQMVPAQWSGVVFTADPVTRSLGTLVVDAVPGIGEDLVSGLVNPEQVKVDRGGDVIERHRASNGDPLPESILTPLVEVSLQIADKLGFPQDIEWAFGNEKLFLLQSRPITTIQGVVHNRSLETASAADLEDPNRRWTRAYADEVWTPPVSPLFYDVQNLSAHLLTRLSNEGERIDPASSVFKYYQAAPYADTAVLARVYSNLPPVARRPSLLAQLPVKEREAVRDAPFRLRPLLRRFWLFELKNRKRRSLSHTHRFLEKSWASFVARADDLAGVDVQALTAEKLDEHLVDIWDLALLVGIECEVAVLYHAHDLKLILSGLLDRWKGDGDEAYAAVSSGLTDSHTVRESDELWQIANHIRELPPETVAKLKAVSFATAVSGDIPGALAVASELEQFLARHPHRGANYKDLIHPRWGDDPELLWKQVLALVADPGQRPRDRNAAAAVKRIKARAEILASLSGWRSIYRKPVLRRLLSYNEIYASLRDNHRFYYDYIWWLLRRLYREKGRRLTTSERLVRSEDVFFLSRPEIEALEAGSLSYEVADARICSRRAEWQATLKASPPKFLEGAYVPYSEGVDPASEALHGIPASPGVVQGRARVLYDVSDLARVGPGEILVTRQTDPSWTPAFSRLSGLVLETGGALAHGASLCREFGLPCVTAIESVTSIVQDGDLLLLSGGEGVVAILERADQASTSIN